METKSKAETYLGFCIRSRKLVFGTDEITRQKKGVFLVLADEALGESSFKDVKKASETLKCPLLLVEKDVLGALLHRIGVKAIAIKDKNLAEALLKEAENEPQFKLYSGGNN